MLDTMVARVIHEETHDLHAGTPSGWLPLPDSLDTAETESNRALIEAVGRAMRTTGYPALRSIEIEACRGIVTLWGRVPRYHQKQLAQAIAKRVGGVRGVANQIDVICCR